MAARSARCLVFLDIACGAPEPASTLAGHGASGGAGGASGGAAREGESSGGVLTENLGCPVEGEPACEACLRECGGVGCEGGRCEVQALYAPPTPDNAVDFSVGTKHLFWTNAAGQVLRSPVDGGAATVIEDEGDRVLGMAADVASVFWLATSGRQVRVADADGENIRVLATLQDQPFDLAVADADTIFVSTQGPGKILQISRTSGTVTELPTTLAGPAFLAASDNDVVWADVSAGTIGALDRATGAMSELASMQAQPQAISLRQGVAYWTNEGARSVMKRSVQGSESAVALAVVNGADALAVGASYCYFGSGTGLWRVPSAGGKLQLVASGHERIVNIVVAGGWVYFADFYDGTIARAAQ